MREDLSRSVQVSERTYRSTQPWHTESGAATASKDARRTWAVPRPRTTLALLAVCVRFASTPSFTIPALCGAVLAWWRYGSLNWPVMGFALAASAIMGWAASAMAEYADYSRSRNHDLRAAEGPRWTAFRLMRRGFVAPEAVLGLSYVLWTIWLACSLWLTFLVGWPVAVFHGFSALILFAITWLPAHIGTRGWGLTELGVFIAYGVLPLVGGYYFQGRTLSWLPLAVSVPCALFALLLHFNYNFIHARRDWLMRKRTLAVNLGAARSVDAGILITVLAYVSHLLVVSLTGLPLLSLIGLASLPVALGVYAQIDRAYLTTEDCINLYRSAAHAGLLTGLLFIAALIIDIVL
jgi:1,4-dihydroxy-2-naphthoate octaprenyltransferase